MRLINNSEFIKVKFDELTWIFILGGIFLLVMSWHIVFEDRSNMGWLLLIIGIFIWGFLIYRSENTVFSVLKNQKKVSLRKYWFYKEILFVESSLRDFSIIHLKEHPNEGVYSLSVKIDGKEYSLFNHFSSSRKIHEIYHMLFKVIEENKT